MAYSLGDSDRLPNYTSSKNIRKKMAWVNGPSLRDILSVDMLEDDPSKAFDDQYDVIWVVVQLKNYSLFTLTCFDADYLSTVTCLTESRRTNIANAITDISHSWTLYDSIRVIILSLVFENEPDRVYLYTAEGLQMEKYLDFGDGFANQVASVTVHFELLYVVFEIGKRVEIYSIYHCLNFGDCEFMGRVDARSVDLPYFSPQRVLKQFYHEAIFYLQCDGHLLIFTTPSSEFRTRPFEVHRYPLPEDSFLEITRHGAAVIEPSGRVVLVHQVPGGVFEFYRQRVMTIKDWSNRLIDTTGTTFYFLGVGKEVLALHPWYTGPGLKYVRFQLQGQVRMLEALDLGYQELLMVLTEEGELELHSLYKMPSLRIDRATANISASLKVSNAKGEMTGPRLTYTVLDDSNLELKPLKDLTNKSLTKGLLAVKNKSMNLTLSDKDWFNGTLFGYRANCTSCGKDLLFKNHVQQEHTVEALDLIVDVHSTRGGHAYVQQWDAAGKLHRNGSLEQYTLMPNLDFKFCHKIAVPRNELFAVSVCDEFTTTFYVTSFAAEKAFTWGPYMTDIFFAKQVEMEWDILVVLEAYPSQLRMYTIDLYEDDDEQFNFLDTFQGSDFSIPDYRGPIQFSSFDLDKLPGKNVYRLFLTEANTGSLVVVTFELVDDNRELQLLQTSYISSKQLVPVEQLPKLKLKRIAILDFIVRLNITIYSAVLTVANWHHIEVEIRMDDRHQTYPKLIRLYERYPWTLENDLKHKDDEISFFAVTYSKQRQQVLAVYDGYFNASAEVTNRRAIPTLDGEMVELRPMMGAFPVNDFLELSYDFNRTNQSYYDGLILASQFSNRLQELSLRRNLSVELVKTNVKSQTINLTAYNSNQ